MFKDGSELVLENEVCVYRRPVLCSLSPIRFKSCYDFCKVVRNFHGSFWDSVRTGNVNV